MRKPRKFKGPESIKKSMDRLEKTYSGKRLYRALERMDNNLFANDEGTDYFMKRRNEMINAGLCGEEVKKFWNEPMEPLSDD